MELGYKLTLKQQQKMVMTQELMQSIQILQYTSQELEGFLEEQMMINPVLEQENQIEKKDKITREDAIGQYIGEYGGQRRTTTRKEDNGEKNYENYITSQKTLKEYLLEQLQFSSRTAEENEIGKFIIESLDTNGYMTIMPHEIGNILDKKEENIMKVLEEIQQFDPVGVASLNLSGCLKKQLQHLNIFDDKMEELLTSCMEELADNRLASISKRLGMSISEVQRRVDIIKSLNPKPGSTFSENVNTTYIVPDVILTKNIDGNYIVEANERAIPSLVLSSYYKKLLEEAKSDQKLKNYLSEKIESAIGIIRSIEQRKETIKNVAQVIADYQKDFFDRGEKYLKPLTQKKIADKLGIHESTVSRSSHGKYIQCHRGTYEFKYFMSQGVSSTEGQDISSKSIKRQLMEIVESEDVKKPYSDQKIVEILKERHILLSRRTVAKYRDEMEIPSSSRRKRY